MENESLRTYWWKAPKDKLHEVLFGIIRHLDNNQRYVSDANLRHLRLYGNLNVLGLTAHSYAQTQGSFNTADKITLNVIQSCCDTVTQKIAKNKPKPTFLTSGGDWTMQKKAKLLDKYVVGQFYALDLYRKGVRAFHHSTVLGTGALKFYKANGKVCAERVFIEELKVDATEAMHGDPRNLYQVKPIPREVLVEMYPSFKEKIMSAKRADDVATHSSLSTSILVCEAWHLPSGEDATDGRHVIAIENQTLFDEEYKKDHFPFEFIRWNHRLLGFFGQGLAEQLLGLQVEINKLLRTAQTLFHLITPAWCVEQSSKVISSQINNDLGRILKFSGSAPTYYAPNAVPVQILEQIENLYRKAFEIAGVSQLGAQSKKPDGLDSGKALREFNDIEAERFILTGMDYEQFFMGAARQIIELTKELAEEDPDFGITVKGRKFMEEIKWKDIDLEDDQYIMQIFPTSFLSQTPAARFKDVQELTQAGYVDKPNSLKLLDFPDLQEFMSLANAGLEDIENMIEAIVERGEYDPPEPYQNLQLGIQTMQSAYLRSKNDMVPEERLEMLRQWINEAQRLLTPPAPPPMPAAPGAPGMPGDPGLQGGAPQAAPMAPPTSDLIPNAPGA